MTDDNEDRELLATAFRISAAIDIAINETPTPARMSYYVIGLVTIIHHVRSGRSLDDVVKNCGEITLRLASHPAMTELIDQMRSEAAALRAKGGGL